MKIKITFLMLLFIAACSPLKDSEFSMYEDMKYEKNLAVECYVLRKDQVCSLFDHDEKKQLTYEELWGIENYLVVRIKNNGDLVSWGKLSCSVNQRDPFIINVPLLNRQMDSFSNILIPVTGILPQKSPDKDKPSRPSFKIEWIELYTY